MGPYKKSPQSGEAGAKKAISLNGWLFIDARKMPSLIHYNTKTAVWFKTYLEVMEEPPQEVDYA